MTTVAISREILSDAICPAYGLLPMKMASDEASVMLLAIGLQESRLEARRQKGGPARGLWQFEKGGGVRGVLQHSSTCGLAHDICDIRGVEPNSNAVYLRLEFDDILAAAFARLFLYTDSHPLPGLGQSEEAWKLYLGVWRPGKPHPRTWPSLYKIAMEAIL